MSKIKNNSVVTEVTNNNSVEVATIPTNKKEARKQFRNNCSFDSFESWDMGTKTKIKKEDCLFNDGILENGGKDFNKLRFTVYYLRDNLSIGGNTIFSSQIQKAFKLAVQKNRELMNKNSTEVKKDGSKKLVGDIWYNEHFGSSNVKKNAFFIDDTCINSAIRYFYRYEKRLFKKSINNDGSKTLSEIEYIPNLMTFED